MLTKLQNKHTKKLQKVFLNVYDFKDQNILSLIFGVKSKFYC